MMPTFAHEEKFYGDKVAVLIRSMCGIDCIKAHKKFTEYLFWKPAIRSRRISKQYYKLCVCEWWYATTDTHAKPI